jgi:hypothetical protein
MIQDYECRATASKEPRRVDRGSPNTSWITQEFFEALGAELSFARVRRPTDNALTERFYGTVKQEEIYLVGNYPDETSAREELGRYIAIYNRTRPHQAMFNFTPAHVHEVNNKSLLLREIEEIKRKTREKRKAYWSEQQKSRHTSIAGVPEVRVRPRSSILGQIRRPFFTETNRILRMRIPNPKTTHFIRRFRLIEKKLDTYHKREIKKARGFQRPRRPYLGGEAECYPSIHTNADLYDYLRKKAL